MNKDKVIISPEMEKRATINRYIRLSKVLEVTYEKFRQDPIPCLEAQAQEIQRLRKIVEDIREVVFPGPEWSEIDGTVKYVEPVDIRSQMVARLHGVERLLITEDETNPAKAKP